MDKTILIIDDDDMLRNTLARGLRNEHFYTLTAPSAEDATEILNRISVDAIVLDRMMTGMDGLTFMKNLRAAGNQTPIIMLTAMGGAENAIAGLAGGADDYLSKPFQLRELVLRLNNITKKHPITNPDDTLPPELTFSDDEFFASAPNGTKTILALSGAEKALLQQLTHPMGNIVAAAPMVAKRLRNKINVVLSNIDIITVRGRGYKLIRSIPQSENTNGDKK